MAIGTGLALLAGSAVSGAVTAGAAKKSAKAQSASADAATQLQREQFEQTTENYRPFLDAGKSGLEAYLYEMGLGPKPRIGGTRPEIEEFNVGGNQSANGSYVGGVNKFRVKGQEFATLGEAEAFARENTVGGTEYGGYKQSPMAKYLMEEGVDSITGSAAASGNLFSGASMKALEDNRRSIISADTSDYFAKLFGLTGMGMSAAGNQAGAGAAYANNAGNLAMEAARAKSQGYMGAANAMTSTIGDMAGIYGYFNNPMAAYASPTMAPPVRPQPNPYY